MSDVFALAQILLDTVTDDFAAADPPIELPTRQYISNGEVAYDCAQLTVELARFYVGTPAQEYAGVARQGEVLAAEFEVALLRDQCDVPVVSDDGAPSTEAIETSAEVILRDGQRLAGVFLRTPKPNGCPRVKVIACPHHGPAGGVAGWVLMIRVSLA